MQKFALLLSVLEPLVINEENAEKATKEGVIAVLGKVLLLKDTFFLGLRHTEDMI